MSKVATKGAKTKVRPNSVEEYIFTEYRNILEQEKELAERKKEIVETVKKKMSKQGTDILVGQDGKFLIVERKYLSWSLNVIKKKLGRQWTSFVKPDEKLLKAKEGMDRYADVKVQEVVTFQRK